jgi:hypothetical protein
MLNSDGYRHIKRRRYHHIKRRRYHSRGIQPDEVETNSIIGLGTVLSLVTNLIDNLNRASLDHGCYRSKVDNNASKELLHYCVTSENTAKELSNYFVAYFPAETKQTAVMITIASLDKGF